MARYKDQEGGFALVELIIVLVVLIALGGMAYYALVARNAAKVANTPQVSSSPKPSPSTVQATDEQLVSAAAKKQCEEQLTDTNGEKTKGVWLGWSKSPSFPDGVEFSADGMFAKGATGCRPPEAPEVGGYGYEIVLKRQGQSWEVIYRGTEAPGTDWAKRYGAPAGWYDPSY